MKSKYLTSFSVVSLLILSFAFAYFTRKPLCIDSKVVEKIDVIEGSKRFEIYRCSQNIHVDFNAFISQNLHGLNQTIAKVERFLSWNAPLAKRVRIEITQDKNQVTIQERTIKISRNLLFSEGTLEKLITKIWFRDNYPKIRQDNLLFEEVFTDLAVYLINQKMTISSNQFEQDTWPQNLKNMKDYCRSNWMFLEHQNFCSEVLTSNKDSVHVLTQDSLRSFLTLSLIESYQQLSIKEQLYFFHRLNQNPMPSTNNTISDIFYDFAALTGMSEAMITQYFKRGFDPFKDRPQVDLMVYLEDSQNLRENFKSILKFAQNNKQSKIAFKVKERVWLLPNRSSFNEPELELKAAKLMWITCGEPSLNQILNFEKQTDRLIFVNSCSNGANSSIALSEFINSEISQNTAHSNYNELSRFIKNNHDAQLIQFHLPSLRLAYDRLSLKKITLSEIFYDPILSEEFKIATGWKQNIIEGSLNKPLSEVEAIEWFHLPN